MSGANSILGVPATVMTPPSAMPSFVKTLREHILRPGLIVVIDNDKSAAGQCLDLRAGLRAGRGDRRLVDIERRAVGLEVAEAQIAGTAEDDNEGAVGQDRDRGFALAVCRCRVDQRFAADRLPARVEDLHLDGRSRTIAAGCIGVRPGDDVAAVGQRRYHAVGIVAACIGVDELLAAPFPDGHAPLRVGGAGAARSPAHGQSVADGQGRTSRAKVPPRGQSYRMRRPVSLSKT